MLYVLLYLLVFALWVLYDLLNAPRGYEDSEGFHYGEPPEELNKTTEE